MLPNLIVIGAGKSGTTSLHYYLGQHPEVFMSTPKELDFFQRKRWREQLDWYQGVFTEPAPVRGETSTGYSAYPIFEDVPQRIREVIPEAKLIYLVRDPIDRLVAHYAQHRINRKENRTLEEAVSRALRTGDDPLNPYLCTSMYATQVDRYLEVFPAERLHVIDNAEMRQDRRAVLRETFAFLGVDEAFDTPRFDEVLNTKRDQRRLGSVGARLMSSRAARLVETHVPRRVRGPVTKPLTRALSDPVERPRLPAHLREELREVLAPEVDRLRRLTGKRFASWSV